MGILASVVLAAVTFLAASITTIHLPGGSSTDDELFPAPPGYLLPWGGGRIHTVTQGEETTFTHNGLAAYGFDFNLNYDTVVASRSGKVAMVYDASNVGGCVPSLNTASNYVVIDHGDGTSALYLHLAYDSAQVAPGDIVSRGQALAISGETGLTCDDEESGPGPHLHFQVQRTEEGRYFTQSLPVAFDDVSANEGVPLEGESYVSGNFGRGKPQKIKLTPHRAQRVFAPKAVPADPLVTEVMPQSEPTPDQASIDSWIAGVQTAVAASATVTETATPTETDTPTPTGTPTPTPTFTPAPIPSDTPLPAASDTPTPEPMPSDTPPAISDTATPAPSDTPPPADTSTPAP